MIDWDGDKIRFMLENAPSIDPTIENAVKSGEYTFLDYTDIQRDTTSAKTGSNFGKLLLVGGLLVVGLVLIVRR